MALGKWGAGICDYIQTYTLTITFEERPHGYNDHYFLGPNFNL